MKSAVPVHKVLRLPRALQLKVLKVLPLLPRNLLLEVLKLLRLPRNLQFQCTKCRSCHEICYWRCSKCCAGHESAVPVHKVLLLPRNLPLEMLKVLRATTSAYPDSHGAALPRRFAVAGAALCERFF